MNKEVKAETTQNEQTPSASLGYADKADRKFYKTVFCIEVLSEEPLGDSLDLEQIDYLITDGGCSGEVEKLLEEILTGEQVAVALMSQGSDPGFFNLDELGRDLDA